MQIPEQVIIVESGEGTTQYLRAGPQEHRVTADAANVTWPPGPEAAIGTQRQFFSLGKNPLCLEAHLGQT